jgi:hypothetical protein
LSTIPALPKDAQQTKNPRKPRAAKTKQLKFSQEGLVEVESNLPTLRDVQKKDTKKETKKGAKMKAAEKVKFNI